MSMQLVLTDDRLGVVESDSDSSPMEEAASCGAWIIRHKPFPKDNRQIGYEVMRRMLEEAGCIWLHEDAPAIEAVMDALEAGRISEAEFVDWVCLRLATA